MFLNTQNARPLILVAILFSISAETRAQQPLARPSKPNIVIMMAGDMGIGDTSAYLGVSLSPSAPPIERTLRSPNLENLARSSILFTDSYAPASMCSATRYSLLTERFAHRSYLKNQGWLPHGPNTPMIQRGLTTLPEMLQAAGYRTVGIGKCHVGMSFADGEDQLNFPVLEKLQKDHAMNVRIEYICGRGFTKWRHQTPRLTIEGVTTQGDDVDFGENRIIDAQFHPSNQPGFGLSPPTLS